MAGSVRMKGRTYMRRIISLLLVCVMLNCVFAGNAVAVEENVESGYTPIYVDGQDADPDMLAFTLEEEIYVPLETVAEALGSSFYTWNSALQSASLMAEDLFLTVSTDEDFIIANGRYLYMENGMQIIDGNVMVPVEPLCIAFGVGLTISDAVYIDSQGTPIESSETAYNEEDLYWLSRIIYAEAGGECFEGMIAVGNVVLNRVEAEEFPNNIYDVIFDRRCGIQFSPAYSGGIYNTPSEDAIKAAKLALDGVNVVGDSLYFNPSSRTSSWASRNREFTVQIGNHNFYA